jgi:hypothetical protein
MGDDLWSVFDHRTAAKGCDRLSPSYLVCCKVRIRHKLHLILTLKNYVSWVYIAPKLSEVLLRQH